MARVRAAGELARASLVGAAAVVARCRRGARDAAALHIDVTTAEPDSRPGIRIAAAGDIACDPASRHVPRRLGRRGFACRQRATSDVLVGAGYAAVLALGDIQYEDGAAPTSIVSYDPAGDGSRRSRDPFPGTTSTTRPAPRGTTTTSARPPATRRRATTATTSARWHLIALNSNCSAVGGCGAGSPQEKWLRADLAASRARCTLAYWHHPRFSSGWHGSDRTYTAFWRALVDADADVVLVGHDHDYERFAPQDPSGRLDLERGMREFVVGTGGKSLRGFLGSRPNSEARDRSSFGVLELTLGAGVYAWRFVSAVGFFADAGAARCH